MLERLRQYLIEAKAKRMLKQATSILSKLEYGIGDMDAGSFTLAFDLAENSPALFIADPSTLGSRLEATIVMPGDLANLKLMSDLSMVAFNNRCSLSGLVPCGHAKNKVELVYCLGQRFNEREFSIGLSYLAQALNGISQALVSRKQLTDRVRFDLSAFDSEDIPFFDPGLIGERKAFMYDDDWGQYIAAAANKNALGGYLAVEIDHDLDIVCACRDFEQINECNLADVGSLVMMELARHRNNKAGPEDKAQVQ